MELRWSTSRGGHFVRSILTFALTVILTALLAAITLSPLTQAQEPGGSWKGDSIVYNGRQYYPAPTDAANTPPNVPADAPYYVSIEEVSTQPLVRKAHVIYFAPGADPPTATSATYLTYDYSSDEEFSNPQGRTQVAMTSAQESSDNQYTSCSVDGIGWFICPVTVFLAEAMDWIFEIVSGFVAVQPLIVNDTNSPLYQSWNVMRSIANIAFIIAFLVIIYSQITSINVSNYGIKKLLPRLIIAAILVNVSYYLCAVLVDISNVAGYSLQQILITIRQETFSITNETWDPEATNGWSQLTAFVLSGGAIAGGFMSLSAATGGSIGAAVYLLVPLLVALLLTIFFVLLVLAARQAIIIILIVIAPLAFVANLLPNTEKWFEKWKDLFTTMLVFFPAFALVFGGSQLAGGIIIQNANNIIMMIFGMAVQIAPLIITPLLLKLSGGLLGRIAGLINDPRRGMLDRTKNWSKDRANMHRQKSLSNTRPGIGRANPFRRTGQWLDDGNRRVKDLTGIYEQANENRYHDSARYASVNEKRAAVDMDKERIHNHHASHIEHQKLNPNSPLYNRAMSVQTSKEALETSQNKVNAHYNQQRSLAGTALNASTTRLELSKMDLDTSTNQKDAYLNAQKAAIGTDLHRSMIKSEEAKFINEGAQASVTRIVKEYKSGQVTSPAMTPELTTIMKTMNATAAEVSAQQQGGEAAQYEIQRSIADQMTTTGPTSERLLDIAAGVGGDAARLRAKAQAVRQLEKLEDDALDTNVELLKYEAAGAGSNIKRWSKNIVDAWASGSTSYGGQDITDERLKAALQAQALEKNISIFEAARGNTRFDQAMLSDIIARNNAAFKGAGGFHLQDDPSLNIDNYPTQAAFEEALAYNRVASLGNSAASSLGGLKFGWVAEFAKAGNLRANIDATLAQPDGEYHLRKAYTNVREALVNPDIRATIGDREDEIRAIEAELARVFHQAPTPDDRPSI